MDGIQHLSMLISTIQMHCKVGDHALLKDVLKMLAKYPKQIQRIDKLSIDDIMWTSLIIAADKPAEYKACYERCVTTNMYTHHVGGQIKKKAVRRQYRRTQHGSGPLTIDPKTLSVQLGDECVLMHIAQNKSSKLDEDDDAFVDMYSMCKENILKSYIHECLHSDVVNTFALFVKDGYGTLGLSTIAFFKPTVLWIRMEIEDKEAYPMQVLELLAICSKKHANKLINYMLNIDSSEQERLFDKRYQAIYLEAIEEAKPYYRNVLNFTEVLDVHDKSGLFSNTPMLVYTSAYKKNMEKTSLVQSHPLNSINNSQLLQGQHLGFRGDVQGVPKQTRGGRRG